MSDNRISNALQIAMEYGDIDGAHHKDWIIDQMVRALTGGEEIDGKMSASPEYETFVQEYNGDEDDEDYQWQVGIAP